MRLLRSVFMIACLFTAPAVLPHGGVVFEDDLCVLKLDFLMAHFTGYQPDSSGNKEFCEDIPEAGESLFVIEYLHEFLREMAFDFRIIEDVNGLGVFASWDEVQAQDIERDTIYYVPPRVEADGVFTAEYRFETTGNYIGIVTARHPTQDKTYHAVFPFAVGTTSWGAWFAWAGLFTVVLAAGLLWLLRRSHRAGPQQIVREV